MDCVHDNGYEAINFQTDSLDYPIPVQCEHDLYELNDIIFDGGEKRQTTCEYGIRTTYMNDQNNQYVLHNPSITDDGCVKDDDSIENIYEEINCMSNDDRGKRIDRNNVYVIKERKSHEYDTYEEVNCIQCHTDDDHRQRTTMCKKDKYECMMKKPSITSYDDPMYQNSSVEDVFTSLDDATCNDVTENIYEEIDFNEKMDTLLTSAMRRSSIQEDVTYTDVEFETTISATTFDNKRRKMKTLSCEYASIEFEETRGLQQTAQSLNAERLSKMNDRRLVKSV